MPSFFVNYILFILYADIDSLRIFGEVKQSTLWVHT